jgi:membrane protease YdiL (CAAX protease family)
MESPEHDRDDRAPLVTDGGAAPAAGPTALVRPPREPIFGPYVSVLLYIVGYFVVGIVLSMILAVGVGLLTGLGIVQMPPIEEELAAIGPMDIEAILKVMEPYLFHLVIASGIYTIFYTVLILGVIFAFSLAVGTIRVDGFSRAAPEGISVVVYLLGAVLAFLSVGIYEELMFRGYILQRLNDRAGKTASILVSSFIFAVMHGLNPGADAFGIFNTVGIGAILCVIYFRTGSLWMPIGFHTAWNFSLGYLYSLPVSGIPLYGVLNVVEIEPGSRLTGGSYGPEAGLACTVALAVWGAWLIWKRTGRGPTEGHS